MGNSLIAEKYFSEGMEAFHIYLKTNIRPNNPYNEEKESEAYYNWEDGFDYEAQSYEGETP